MFIASSFFLISGAKKNKFNLFLIDYQSLTTFFQFCVFSKISQHLIGECLKSAQIRSFFLLF